METLWTNRGRLCMVLSSLFTKSLFSRRTLVDYSQHLVTHGTTCKSDLYRYTVYVHSKNVTYMYVFPVRKKNANVDKIMRFIPKREWEFNHHGQRIRKEDKGSDVSLDISMVSEPYYSAEVKEAIPIEQNSVHSVKTLQNLKQNRNNPSWIAWTQM